MKQTIMMKMTYVFAAVLLTSCAAMATPDHRVKAPDPTATALMKTAPTVVPIPSSVVVLQSPLPNPLSSPDSEAEMQRAFIIMSEIQSPEHLRMAKQWRDGMATQNIVQSENTSRGVIEIVSLKARLDYRSNPFWIVCSTMPDNKTWMPQANVQIGAQQIWASEVGLIDPKNPEVVKTNSKCYHINFLNDAATRPGATLAPKLNVTGLINTDWASNLTPAECENAADKLKQLREVQSASCINNPPALAQLSYQFAASVNSTNYREVQNKILDAVGQRIVVNLQFDR